MTAIASDLNSRALAALHDALATANQSSALEPALSAISAAAWTALGDPLAHERPGALKTGEEKLPYAKVRFQSSPVEAKSIMEAPSVEVSATGGAVATSDPRAHG